MEILSPPTGLEFGDRVHEYSPLPMATVPEAEMRGAAQAWALEAGGRARLRERAQGATPSTGLSESDVFALEVWTSLQWAALGDE